MHVVLDGIWYHSPSVTSIHYRVQVSAPYPQPFRTAYLVEFPITAVKHYLEGNVGSRLETRCAGPDADIPKRACSLEITDDEVWKSLQDIGETAVEIITPTGGKLQTSSFRTAAKRWRGRLTRSCSPSQTINPFVRGNQALFAGCVYPPEDPGSRPN